nr:hypothetical protein [uncultured Gellertiella sp.]
MLSTASNHSFQRTATVDRPRFCGIFAQKQFPQRFQQPCTAALALFVKRRGSRMPPSFMPGLPSFQSYFCRFGEDKEKEKRSGLFILPAGPHQYPQ